MSGPKQSAALRSGSFFPQNVPIQDPLEDENVKKSSELLRNQENSKLSIKSMVEHFNNLLFGFVGQRISSLQKSKIPGRTRLTPVDTPESELRAKKMKTPGATMLKSPTKTVSFETYGPSVLTACMDEPFNKSLRKQDGGLVSSVWPFSLNLNGKDLADKAGTTTPKSLRKLGLGQVVAKSEFKNCHVVHQNESRRVNGREGSPRAPKKLLAKAKVRSSFNDDDKISAIAEDFGE